MKKNLLFASLLFAFGAKLTAQTINSSNMPSIGEEYSYFQDTLQYSQGAAGNGVTWNFSNVTFPATLEHEYYVNPSTTLNASSFPTATIAEGQAFDTNYTYFKINATEYTAVGAVQGTQLQTYTNPLTYATFPLTFGTTVTDNFAGSINTAFGVLSVTGNVNGIADGSGMITLPGSGGTVQALRFKVIIQQTLTLTVPFAVTINNYTTQYMWFDPSTKNVIFQVGRDSTVSSFAGQPSTTDISFTVRQKQGMVLTGASEFKTPNLMEVFPNPSFGKTRVNYSAKQNEQINVSVFDVTGKLVEKITESGNSGSSSIELNTSEWEKGIYLVQITQDKYQVTKKLVVK